MAHPRGSSVSTNLGSVASRSSLPPWSLPKFGDGGLPNDDGLAAAPDAFAITEITTKNVERLNTIIASSNNPVPCVDLRVKKWVWSERKCLTMETDSKFSAGVKPNVNISFSGY